MTTQPDRLREAAQAFIEASVLVDTMTLNDGPAYQDAWDAYHFAQAELRAALTEAAAAPDLIADPGRHYHDDGCPHLPRVPWNNPKAKP